MLGIQYTNQPQKGPCSIMSLTVNVTTALYKLIIVFASDGIHRYILCGRNMIEQGVHDEVI